MSEQRNEEQGGQSGRGAEGREQPWLSLHLAFAWQTRASSADYLMVKMRGGYNSA